MQEIGVQSLGREDPLVKEMAIHSSILAWKIPWTEEPGGLQSMEPQRSRHNLGSKEQKQWFLQPTPPGLLSSHIHQQHAIAKVTMTFTLRNPSVNSLIQLIIPLSWVLNTTVYPHPSIMQILFLASERLGCSTTVLGSPPFSFLTSSKTSSRPFVCL